MIKINCEVCKKEIRNPRMNQVTCGGECSKAYLKAYQKALSKLAKKNKEEFLKLLKKSKEEDLK